MAEVTLITIATLLLTDLAIIMEIAIVIYDHKCNIIKYRNLMIMA